MHSNRYFYRLLKNVHWSIGSALQSLLTPMMSWTEEPTGQTVHTWILSQKRSRLDLLQLLYQPFFSASLSPSVGSYSPPPAMWWSKSFFNPAPDLDSGSPLWHGF